LKEKRFRDPLLQSQSFLQPEYGVEDHRVHPCLLDDRVDTLGEEVLRYNFTNAMCSKLSLSEGGATTSGVQVEEATLACETLGLG
jgi:hypothetical protein